MTKALTKAEKRDKKEARKQQKAASKTMKTVTQPKPESAINLCNTCIYTFGECDAKNFRDLYGGVLHGKEVTEHRVVECDQHQEAEPVNLCDDCAYEFGECEGKPKFASDQDKTLTGPEADRVIECPAFVNVAKMPTAQEAAAKNTIPEIVIVCSGGCGRTTEGITSEATSGEFKQVDESGVPQWTCPECLDKRGESPAGQATEELEEPEVQVIRKDLPERPDPKRFQAEEDFGNCPSCEMALKRTAFNRYQDAIRCTNGRCRAYRVVVKTVSTGVK